MANKKGNIKNLKNFKKGQSGNPKGRPVNLFNTAFKKLTAIEMEEIASLIVKQDVKALRAAAKKTTTTVIQMMIINCVIKIIDKGDISSLDVLLNRMIGKVKDQVHHTGEMHPASTVIVTIPSNGREVKIPDANNEPNKN